jgi:tRNA(Ile)-lysidine synthase
MKPLANCIIRPLLFATRKSIEEYCKKNKISFREDRTNADTNIIRNKIRHNVIPLLREINPSVESTLNETAERLGGIYEILTEGIVSIRNSIFREKDDKITVTINQLEPYLHNKTYLFELFRPFGLTGSLTVDLVKIMKGPTGGQISTGTYRILKNRKEIIISLLSEFENRTFIAASLAELKMCPYITGVKTISASKRFSMDADPGMAYLDFRKISFPVTIRKWQAGDYFFPFGMNRKKKLSDYFIDGKFSRLEKEKALIMEAGGDIVWIIGRRIDNRFRLTESTQKVLVLKA